MPKNIYKSEKDLPKRVRDNLPAHGEEIYKEAHNSALEEYKEPGKRRDRDSQEAIAHKVAWVAVKKNF